MLGLRFSELLVFVIFVVPTVWALSDVLRTPTDVWARSRQSQGLWAVLVLIVPVIAPVLYYWIARPRLRSSS
jgi:hypothetical protein